MMWGSGYGGWGGGMGWLGPVFMLAIWALIITGGVFLTRFFARQGRGRLHEDSALDLLKRRYAQGEIGREEYDEKRKDLT